MRRATGAASAACGAPLTGLAAVVCERGQKAEQAAPDKLPSARRMRAWAQELDPGASLEGTLVCIASAFLGPREAVVAAHLGLPQSVVRAYGARLRAAGIWRGDDCIGAEWWDERPGHCELAFVLDGMVADGLMTRELRADGAGLYSLTDTGTAATETETR